MGVHVVYVYFPPLSNYKEMNAVVRRIDLTVNILAPILVGQIMTFASMTVAGIFIAAWNLGSLILEYYLLLRVYRKVPRLAMKFGKDKTGIYRLSTRL